MHNRAMFEWSDLRFFLAVARHGSTLAAARALGVNQSTVQRRIGEMEERLGEALVLRHASGYQLTEFGKALLPAAMKVEEAIIGLERQALAYGKRPEGVIRLTCPEPLVSRIAGSTLLSAVPRAPPGSARRNRHERSVSRFVEGEADVALRSGEPSDQNLVGRRDGDSVWAVYAGRSYVQQHGRPQSVADITQHAIVAFEGALAGHRAAQWLSSVAPAATVAASNNSARRSHGGEIRCGPCAAAHHHRRDARELVQVLPPVEDSIAAGICWRIDLRGTPRVSAFSISSASISTWCGRS